MSDNAYFTEMRGPIDELAAAGKKIDDDGQILTLLAGLDTHYNLLVLSMSAKIDPIVLTTCTCSFLLSRRGWSQALAAQYPSANATSCGHGGGKRYYHKNHGGRGGHSSRHVLVTFML